MSETEDVAKKVSTDNTDAWLCSADGWSRVRADQIVILFVQEDAIENFMHMRREDVQNFTPQKAGPNDFTSFDLMATVVDGMKIKLLSGRCKRKSVNLLVEEVFEFCLKGSGVLSIANVFVGLRQADGTSDQTRY